MATILFFFKYSICNRLDLTLSLDSSFVQIIINRSCFEEYLTNWSFYGSRDEKSVVTGGDTGGVGKMIRKNRRARESEVGKVK